MNNTQPTVTVIESVLKVIGQVLWQILVILWKTIEIFFQALAMLITNSTPGEKVPDNAQFGGAGDIGSRWNDGFLISSNHRLSRRQSYQNILLAGPPGAGKTSRLLIPLCLSMKNCSLVINDGAEELHQNISGAAAEHFLQKTLNFSDSSKSCGYNPLSRIKSPQDAGKIADVLTRATVGKGGDPFWALSTKNVLTALIQIVLYQDPQYRNMANVVHVLTHLAVAPEKIDILFARTQDSELLLRYKAIISMPERTLQNVIASAQAALEPFTHPEIAKVTSVDTLSFEQLRQKPHILYLHNSISEQKFISVVQSVFFEQFYQYVLDKLPTPEELDMYVILEEASSLYVPILPVATANTRKHRCGNVICVQSPKYLDTLYGSGDGANIANNCLTKIFMPGISNLDVMKEIETLGGKTKYTDEKGEHTRPLISVDEVRQLSDDEILIISANKPLIKTKTTPFYKSWKFKSKASIPPIPITGEIPKGPIPLIPL